MLALIAFGVVAVYLASRSNWASATDAFVGPVQPINPGDAEFVGPLENTDMDRAAPSLNVSQGIVDLASAIASAEGYGIPGAIPTRANNPGDLVMPGWTKGSLGAQKISVFDSPEDGWQALYRQLQRIADGRSGIYAADMTIGEMGDHWTATDKPDWARNVARWLAEHGWPDVTVNTTLDTILYV